MGDLNLFKSPELMRNIAQFYLTGQYKFDRPLFPKLWIFPVFVPTDDYMRGKLKLPIAKEVLVKLTKPLKLFQTDPPPCMVAYPPLGVRVFNLVTDDFELGKKIRTELMFLMYPDIERDMSKITYRPFQPDQPPPETQ